MPNSLGKLLNIILSSRKRYFQHFFFRGGGSFEQRFKRIIGVRLLFRFLLHKTIYIYSIHWNVYAKHLSYSSESILVNVWKHGKHLLFLKFKLMDTLTVFKRSITIHDPKFTKSYLSRSPNSNVIGSSLV